MTEYPKNDKEIAQFWGVPVRTVFRWKGDDAPLDNYDDMLTWFATRKNLPRAVLAKIRMIPAQENVSSPVSGGVAGAAAALKRLESTELQAFERMQAALARGNPLEIREARESWLKISESLRRFDLMIEQNRRDAGELVSVSELKKFISLFIAFANTAFRLSAESSTNEIAGKKEPEIYSHIRQLGNKALFMAAIGYIKGGGENFPDARLVAYAEQCVEEEFGWFPAESRDNLEQSLVALIKQAQAQKP